jgi:LPS-assembly protein
MTTLLIKNRTTGLMFRKALLLSVSLLAIGAAGIVTSQAQTVADRLAAKQQQGGNQSKMLVDAREVEFDRDKDSVSAVGDVKLYYQGRILEADRVTYDRKNKRVRAEGNARLTDTDGTKTYGDRFDLTDDFKDGFIETLRVVSTQNQRISANRAERTGGEQTVFERGTYTPCLPCKDAPEKPPLWQVRAARVIHNNSEQMMYYENATIEFWGVPVMWMPFLSGPDPTVKRKTGVLAPRYLHSESLGFGIAVPIYWAAAQNYDVTFTPTYLSRQGFLGDAQFRHRLEHGSYNIRANGINQLDRKAFAVPVYAGGGSKDFRGSISSRGRFYLNEKWNFGWDGAIATDKFYYTDYKTRPQNYSTAVSGEIISSVYLRGRGERSWVDLSAYHFLGLSGADWKPQSGSALPSFDLDRRFTPDQVGGELKLAVNSTVIRREAAAYQGVPLSGQSNYTPTYAIFNNKGVYEACRYSFGGQLVGSYSPGSCLLRGFAGEYNRNSVDVSWRKRLVDPIGQEWTPFVGLRGDASWLRLNRTGYTDTLNSFGGTGYSNGQQGNFFGGNANNIMVRGMPSIGVEYRYPFFASSSFGMHHVEPIGQLIVRPNESRIGRLPNEDAQSLVFDDTSLFSSNKFSGYDRTEGGTRANYGLRYTFRSNKGPFASLIFGQSTQLLGRNSFAAYDLVNTGRNSGLESRRSDYVAATTVQPIQNISFTTRGRFDEKTLDLKRVDVSATSTYGNVSTQVTYSRIAPQPEQGFIFRREGVQFASSVSLPWQFYVAGSVVFDMDRYLSDRAYVAVNGGTYKDTPWRMSASSFVFGYRDECTIFNITYTRSYSDYVTTTKNRQTSAVMVRLELKDLGDVNLTRKSDDK